MEPITSSQLFEQDPDMKITEQDDGSAIVEMPEESVDPESSHGDNLAETLSEFKLNTISSRYLELIDKDKEARKKRDEQYEEGLRRTGLGDDAPGGATFDGASKVVHPLLAEGCIDYAARAIKEIFPANGPVKTKIQGKTDGAKLEKSRCKADYLNWQLTNQIEEYRSEKEILLTQLPLGGSQYEKYWYDQNLGRIRMEFVPVDKVLLPFSASSFYSSPRITHIQDISEEEFDARVASGFYRDVEGTLSNEFPEETASQKANDKIEGKSTSDNVDGLRRVYEISCNLELDEDEGVFPYVLHIDDTDSDVLAIYRNWDVTDEKRRSLDWWVEDKFIPWRGVYGIGLPHLIGGMAAALTGSLRALLDSAHINNAPTAIKLKGGRASGQNTVIDVTNVQEIDAPAGIDDIRKVMMPMPFNPPSQVLFQLLDWVTNQAKGVVATTEEKMDQIGDRTPVGTTMAMIEQGSATYSAIHARLHESQRRALRIICRLNSEHPCEEMARFGVTAEDFLDNSDIEPVSDPHIFSEAQRYAQLQEQIKLLQVFPQLPWNTQELARRAMTLLRVDGIDAILPKQPEPVTADPVSENVAAMSGTPLKPVQEQDHEAHIQAHLAFIMNPINSAIPGPMPQLGAIMAHVQEHLVMEYEKLCMDMLPQATQQFAATGDVHNPDKIAMTAANMAAQQIQQISQALGPLLQQAGQILSSKMPQPPVDPAIQKTFEAAMAEIKRKADADAARLQFDQSKYGNDTQMAQQQQQMDDRLAHMGEAFKLQIAQMQEEGKQAVANMAHQVDMMKNDADNKQHQMTELLKNRDDNQTAVIIEQMKQAVSEMRPQIPTEVPAQDDTMLRQMQEMLNQIEKAKTGDALTATVEGLRTLMEGQRGHQEHMIGIASQLLRGNES